MKITNHFVIEFNSYLALLLGQEPKDKQFMNIRAEPIPNILVNRPSIK